jgi:ubiquinone/menaquinone biosynthesis C-methylase UbiE
VTIRNGSALDLPLPDAAFDRAYSQNVVMNIADKPRFYCEAFRVLRPGGVVALSNVCAGPAGPPHFPVPWAETPTTSFLATPEETRGDIAAAGFEILSFRDTSEELRDERLGQDGMPGLGLHIVMGERFSLMRRNSARSAAENRTRTVEILARKPAQG